MFHALISFIVETVSMLGYTGIVVMMALESSFFPFPSEVAMIPAGYLASQGQMNVYIVVACGVLGSLLGAWLWVTILVAIGYFVGANEQLVREWSQAALFWVLGGCAVLLLLYWKLRKS